MSPMGEAVPRLPPIVARLRMSGDANCGNSSASSGTRPSRRCSTSESESAAPISMLASPTSSARSSGRRSIAIESGARRPRRFTSTPQSVVPATTTASGSSRSIRSASSSEAGRTNRPSPALEPRRDGRRARGDPAARRAGRPARGSRVRTRHPGSADSRCTGRGCRSARAGRSRSGRARSARPSPVPLRQRHPVGRAFDRVGRTPPPCCRRSPGCSTRTASRRPRRAPPARGAAPRASRGPRRSRSPGRRAPRPARGTR